jgi:hypothetical protein
MPTITSPTLTAEILTGRMPLSDSFNRANAANTRMGIHHGLQLSYIDGTNWPNKSYNTEYLQINAGSAVIGATLTNAGASLEPVLLTAILSSNLVIDLLAYGIGVADATTYRVYLQVAYIAPSVNNTTGLVSNIGSNDVSIIIEDESVDFGSRKGLLLGRFNRQQKFVETVGDQVFNTSDIDFDNAEGCLPNSVKKSTQLGQAVKSFVLRSASNLRKHVRVENIADPAIAETLKTTTMPLAGITNSVATSAGDIGGWALPIDWYNTSLQNIVIANGIYRDVEKFELFNCRFKNNMQFAFHRTPGHNKMADWIATVNVSKLITKSEVAAFADFGAQQFIFDAKGSVFEGDLTLDLVLDFTGQAHQHPYKIFIRNLTVMGSLIINYGQSWLGLAGGTLGTIEYDNVQVYGTNNIARPWPCVQNVPITDPVANPAYNAFGFISVQYFINTAAEIAITGYVQSPGPLLLQNWRDTSGAAFTKGVIIPTYLHSKIAGSGGNMVMGDPWMLEGNDAGVLFKNSTLPTSVLPILIASDPACGTDQAASMVRVKLQNCKYQNKSLVVNSFGYLNAAEFAILDDRIYTLTSFNTTNPWDLHFKRNLVVVGDVGCNNVNASGSVSAAANLVAGNRVISTGGADIGAGAIIRGSTLTQGLTVVQGLTVLGNTGVDVAQGVLVRGATGLVLANGGISSKKDITATTGSISALAGNVEGLNITATDPGGIVEGSFVEALYDLYVGRERYGDFTPPGTVMNSAEWHTIAFSFTSSSLTAGVAKKLYSLALPAGEIRLIRSVLTLTVGGVQAQFYLYGSLLRKVGDAYTYIGYINPVGAGDTRANGGSAGSASSPVTFTLVSLFLDSAGDLWITGGSSITAIAVKGYVEMIRIQ